MFAYSVSSLSDVINGVGNVTSHSFDNLSDPTWKGATLTPAAFSVQLMNPGALQTTSGVVYEGRFKTIPEFDLGTGLAAQQFGENFVAYNNPLCIYQPNVGSLELQLLVTCEWRVRFDPTNPAQATHTMHKPSTDQQWHQAVSTAMSTGNGVKDIVEVVAALGKTVGSLM